MLTDPSATLKPGTQYNLSVVVVAWTAAAHQGAGAGDVTISVVPNGFGAGIDEVTVALPPALGDGGKLFVRLNVEVANTPPAE